MSYNFNGAWSKITNYTAPLRYNGNNPSHPAAGEFSSLNVDGSIGGALAAGVPAEKICMGLPFFALRFKGVDHGPNKDGIIPEVQPDNGPAIHTRQAILLHRR